MDFLIGRVKAIKLPEIIFFIGIRIMKVLSTDFHNFMAQLTATRVKQLSIIMIGCDRGFVGLIFCLQSLRILHTLQPCLCKEVLPGINFTRLCFR